MLLVATCFFPEEARRQTARNGTVFWTFGNGGRSSTGEENTEVHSIPFLWPDF